MDIVTMFGLAHLLGGGSETPVAVPGRYALFVAANEQEALSYLTDAYRSVLDDPPIPTGFDEDGDLVTRIEFTGRGGRPKSREEDDCEISIETYRSGVLVMVELFDEDWDPNPEKIMIARYIAMNAGQ
ncbi:hypothetical protein ACFL1B_02810 [Nanoarchaeota archaeon]